MVQWSKKIVFHLSHYAMLLDTRKLDRGMNWSGTEAMKSWINAIQKFSLA